MSVNIGWPQGIALALMFADACACAYLHGRVTKKKWNFWVKSVEVMAWFMLLAWGGFFK